MRGFTLLELLVSVALISVLAALLLPGCMGVPVDAAATSSCQNNLKQLGLVFKMYASEHQGLYPRVHGDEPWGADAAIAGDCENMRDDGDLCPKMDAIHPEYLVDPNILVCPGSPVQGDRALRRVRSLPGRTCAWEGRISDGDNSYQYTGFVLDKTGEDAPLLRAGSLGVRKESDAAFALLIGMIVGGGGGEGVLRGPVGDRNPANDAVLDADLSGTEARGWLTDLYAKPPVPLGNRDTDTFRRLCEGVERFLITDTLTPEESARVQSTLPVLWEPVAYLGADILFNHIPGGANVLYMDGHVAYVRYPSGLPAAPRFAGIIGLLHKEAAGPV